MSGFVSVGVSVVSERVSYRNLRNKTKFPPDSEANGPNSFDSANNLAELVQTISIFVREFSQKFRGCSDGLGGL